MPAISEQWAPWEFLWLCPGRGMIALSHYLGYKTDRTYEKKKLHIGSHWRAGRVSEQVWMRHGFLHFSVSGHGKVLCNGDDEWIDKCSFINSYAWKKLCGTGQGMKWEALSHSEWMQVALGFLCNAWAFCERRKGRKVRDSWPTKSCLFLVFQQQSHFCCTISYRDFMA